MKLRDPWLPSRALRTASLIAAGAALLAVWHFGGLPGDNRLVRLMHVAAHFPLFGAFTIVVFALLRLHARGAAARGKTTYLAAFAIMIAVSLSTEGLQTLLPHRHGSLGDVAINLLGAAVALALLALREPAVSRATRVRLWVGIVAGTSLIVVPVGAMTAAYTKRWLEFPAIVSFGSILDLLHVSSSGAVIRRAELPAPYGRAEDPRSLEVVLHGPRFPGVAFRDPPPDWRGFHALELDLTNPEPAHLRLTLRIDDRWHDGSRRDRLNHPIELPGEERTRVRIPLESIRDAPEERSMDLEQIAVMLLYAPRDGQGRRFYITAIRLIP